MTLYALSPSEDDLLILSDEGVAIIVTDPDATSELLFAHALGPDFLIEACRSLIEHYTYQAGQASEDDPTQLLRIDVR